MGVTSNLPILTRKAVIFGAIPIMLANAGAPLAGFVDIWVIGNYAFESSTALAAIGLGVVIYGIFYWGFGFLRMSTGGLSAQAHGAGNQADVQAHLFRAVPMGFAIGLLIFLFQAPLVGLLMQFFPASHEVSAGARQYLSARLWGLPATLGSIALMGWFIGLAKPKRALFMQIVLNFINVPLSILFVAVFGWELRGVGFASAIAEWGGLLAGIILATGEINLRGGLKRQVLNAQILLDIQALKRLGVTNSNIFIRTIALTLGFTFFARAATEQGTVFLASHTILMQFITMMALIMDAFAHVAEAHAGAAFGARDKKKFKHAVRLTSEFSFVFAVFCAGFAIIFGPYIIDLMTDNEIVRQTAKTYLPLCALTPIIGFGAWQLDGIYIGITRTKAMRNAGIIALIMYLFVHYLLAGRYGGAGVWFAFLFYYFARAVTMLPAWPGILRDMEKLS